MSNKNQGKNILERLKEISAFLPSPLYWEDANSVILGANKQVLKEVGLKSLDSYVGRSLYELYPKEMADIIKLHNEKVMQTGEVLAQEEEILDVTTGEVRYFTAVKAPLYDENGEIIGVVGTSINITDRKKMEEELKEAKREAEIAKTDAQNANKLKTNFVQNMQHDIRTPASGVWKALDKLVKHHETPSREMLIMLRNSAKQLWDICNDIIDFDRIESGDIPVLSKKLNIREVIEGVIQLNESIAYEKGLTLSFSVEDNIPNIVKGDEHRLSRILVNLLGNAIKFTHQGAISITAKIVKEYKKGYIINFEVKDSGIGMASENQTSLYEKFNRLSPANSTSYKGSGLGLRIVKKYVDDLGGEVDVVSKLKEGTTFYINIPFEKPLVQELYRNQKSRVSIPKKKAKEEPFLKEGVVLSNKTPKTYRVLLIEDDLLSREIGGELLKLLNCQVTEAINVKSAIDLLEKDVFDCVISDIGLPDGTGIDIIHAIRKDKKSLNNATPFFALTANADSATITKAKNAGFKEVMVKPLDQDQIEILLKTLTSFSKIDGN